MKEQHTSAATQKARDQVQTLLFHSEKPHAPGPLSTGRAQTHPDLHTHPRNSAINQAPAFPLTGHYVTSLRLLKKKNKQKNCLFGCTGLSCGMRNSQLRYVGSLNSSLSRDGTQAPAMGARVSATGPPGKPWCFPSPLERRCFVFRPPHYLRAPSVPGQTEQHQCGFEGKPEFLLTPLILKLSYS